MIILESFKQRSLLFRTIKFENNKNDKIEAK